MTVDNSAFPDKAEPTFQLATSPCYSEASSASTVNSSISNTNISRDIQHKYHINPQVLGTGYNGSVRRCFDRVTGEQYAVKSIPKVHPADKRGGLSRETILLKEMKHRNIVRLVDVYEDARYLHIVTDLCEGGELFDKIVEKKSSSGGHGPPCFAEDEAARVLRQILSAVLHMHERGVAHRDIKPENILFETADTNSPVKIIDFGLARRHFRGDRPMTNVVGTPYYIAPEVLRRRYDKSCDLWSVGIVAYTMLCGYPPFNGDTNKEVHNSVKKGQYCFPSKDWSGVSKEAVEFICRLLQMDPRKRMTVNEAMNHPWIVKHIHLHGFPCSMEAEEATIKYGASWGARDVRHSLPNTQEKRTGIKLAFNHPSAERHIRSCVVARNEVREDNLSVEVVLEESPKKYPRIIRRIIEKLK